MDTSDPVRRAREIAYGFAMTRIAHAVTSLGVVDAIASGPRPLADIAGDTGLDQDPLERLLIGAAATGLTSHAAGLWGLTPTGELFATGSPFAVLMGRVVDWTVPLYDRLTEAARDNRSVLRDVMGFDSMDEMYKGMDDDEFLRFLRGLHMLWRVAAPAALAVLDLSGVGTLVDVGGGSGGLSIEAVRRHPGLRAIVFDLERTVRLGRAFAEEAGVADRVTYRAGDLFREPVPAADAAALSLMLRWMSPAQQQTALRACYDALPSGGLLVVLETFIEEDLSGPMLPAVFCLTAFLMGEGRDRTAAQWTSIVEQAGFTDVRTHRLGEHIARDVLVARRP